MLKHIISIFIWTAIGLYLLLVILLHIPYIQKNLGSQVASAISHKLDAKVSIGRVDFGFLNRFIIDDVIIYDRKGKEMIKAARISARIELIPLTEGKVSIRIRRTRIERHHIAHPFGFKDKHFHNTKRQHKV